ncbi:MAG: nitroreductase, partial [Xanthomonadales bacterium]|nr:nitroreductase [Xanthomonadales bacterium]
MPMLTLAALDSRRSVPTRQLATPGPDPDQLLRILRSASRVPDHGKRVPFRFLR